MFFGNLFNGNYMRQMQEKFRAKGKKLYFGIVDLEKKLLIVFREK